MTLMTTPLSYNNCRNAMYESTHHNKNWPYRSSRLLYIHTGLLNCGSQRLDYTIVQTFIHYITYKMIRLTKHKMRENYWRLVNANGINEF